MFFMVIIGALSLSLVLFNVSDIDPRFLRHMELQKFVMLLIITAPYLWIIISLMALTFGIMAFRKTSRGYRRSTLFITSLVVLCISALGFFSHFLKIDSHMHGMLSKRAPNFRGLTEPREGRWLRSDDGLIGGEVTNVESGKISLKSFDNNVWEISYSAETDGNNPAEIAIGEKIGVMGKKIGEFSMQAFSIRIFPDDWMGQPPRGQHPSDEKELWREGFPPPPGFPSTENMHP